MSSDAIAILGFVALFVLMLLRVPVGMAMGLVGVTGFAYLNGSGPALKIVGHTSMRTVTDWNFAVIPMFLLALTVSTTAAIATLVFNAVYNVVENYYLAPKVYGKEMQLSSLAVILAFAVGAELAGVIGALIALPFAAIYPAIEDIWLAKARPDIARDHRQIEQTEEH